jgi:hypothetical protein
VATQRATPLLLLLEYAAMFHSNGEITLRRLLHSIQRCLPNLWLLLMHSTQLMCRWLLSVGRRTVSHRALIRLISGMRNHVMLTLCLLRLTSASTTPSFSASRAAITVGLSRSSSTIQVRRFRFDDLHFKRSTSDSHKRCAEFLAGEYASLDHASARRSELAMRLSPDAKGS